MSEIQPYVPPAQVVHAAQPPVMAVHVPHAPMYGGQQTDQQPASTTHVVLAWVAAVLTFLYMLPWAIAATRGRSNTLMIALLNLFLGWSLVGWIAALVMACWPHAVVATVVPIVVTTSGYPAPGYATTGPAGLPAAGWYPAPAGYGKQYWDGRAWTGHTMP